MYTHLKASKTTLKVNKALEGETIEAKVRRITEQQDPITDGAPQIFTERKDGVLPEHNIRTDRFELAVEAMDKVTTNKLAKREGAAATKKGAANKGDTEGGANPDTAAKGGDSGGNPE